MLYLIEDDFNWSGVFGSCVCWPGWLKQHAFETVRCLNLEKPHDDELWPQLYIYELRPGWWHPHADHPSIAWAREHSGSSNVEVHNMTCFAWAVIG